jgi:hypothetical protein
VWAIAILRDAAAASVPLFKNLTFPTNGNISFNLSAATTSVDEESENTVPL